MKKHVLLAALLLSGALGAYAQTKGTNSIGLGIETSKNKYNYAGENSGSATTSNFSLRYAHFIKDNVKLGLGLSHTRTENQDNNEEKGYGASFLYQKYFPVYKKLYVFLGGEAAYSHQDISSFNYASGGGIEETFTKVNGYHLGAYGGASYFLGKHWELEARVLSANAGYSSIKNDRTNFEGKASAFSLKTAGAFTNLGFSINFLF